MGQRLTEICQSRPHDPATRDPALDATLSGRWRGEYDDGTGPTAFDAELRVTDGVLSGSTSEPNRFGPPHFSRLEAELAGDAFASRQLVWLKTYRTGSVDHSVLYVGQLATSGRRIDGHWRLGTSHGTFWLEPA